MAFDRAIRVAWLMVSACAIYVYWEQRDNGRYVYHHSQGDNDVVVVDSRTAKLLTIEDKSFIEIDPLKGRKPK